MSECGSKIAVRLKNQMRKAKVESVERIIKNWDEQLSREVPRNTFEKRFAKWCPKMDKWHPTGIKMGPQIAILTAWWPKRSPKTLQKRPKMGPDLVRGYPPRPFREQVRKNDPPPRESVFQLGPKWTPKSLHWRLGGSFFRWFFASFFWLIF